MPIERKESQMSEKSFRFANDDEGYRKEYAWACELTKDEAEHTWEFTDEDEDEDFLMHTLYLRLAVLGKDVKAGERQIVQAVTKDYYDKEVTMTFINMASGDGKHEMINLDLNFQGHIPVTFKLIEGSGPLHLSGMHSIEFPDEQPQLGDTVLEDTEDGEEEATEATETEEEKADDKADDDKAKGKGAKRKSGAQAGRKQKQRGKLDSSAMSTGDDDEEEEDDEEDMEDEEEESEEEEEAESSPEVPKKKAKGKGKAKAEPAKPAAKAAKGQADKKKAGKKGKAK